MTTELFPFRDEDSDKSERPSSEAPWTGADPSQDPDVAADGTWEGYLPRLRERFPDAKDGTLFCVYKLEENPDLTLKDFRAEAALRGVPLSGRSLHSAKVLLGMEAPATRRRRKTEDAAPEPDAPRAPARRGRNPPAGVDLEESLGDLGAELEDALRRAVDEAARARTDRLRDAIREAIDVLQAALDD